MMEGEDSFIPFDPDVEVRRTARNLPHWEQAGRTYWVTFRLADSIPVLKLNEWKAECDVWRAAHPEPWSEAGWREYQRRFVDRIERWSDAGHGACELRKVEVREIVAGALRFFDGDRYDLGDFVVMPNHVHLLVTPRDGWVLKKLLHSWKSFTAHEVNRILAREGVFWMEERFDHVVRSWEQLERLRRYVAENPVKAGLAEGEFTLGRGG